MSRTINLTRYLFYTTLSLLVWGVMIHEYGHLVYLTIIGVNGSIISTNLSATYALEPLTQTQSTLFSLAGGILEALYGLYLTLSKDNETWLTGVTLTTWSLIYAVTETMGQTTLGAVTASGLTFILILYLNTVQVIHFD